MNLCIIQVGLSPTEHASLDWTHVGSGTGAVARQDLAWLYPGFPPSCPVNRVRGSVSSSRHLARSMKISFTTRSCTLHDKVYETYPIGVAFDDSSEAVTRIQVSALAIDYSTASRPRPWVNAKSVQPSTLPYSLRLRSCRLPDAFIISPLPHCVDQDFMCSKAPSLHGRYPASSLLRT